MRLRAQPGELADDAKRVPGRLLLQGTRDSAPRTARNGGHLLPVAPAFDSRRCPARGDPSISRNTKTGVPKPEEGNTLMLRIQDLPAEAKRLELQSTRQPPDSSKRCKRCHSFVQTVRLVRIKSRAPRRRAPGSEPLHAPRRREKQLQSSCKIHLPVPVTATTTQRFCACWQCQCYMYNALFISRFGEISPGRRPRLTSKPLPILCEHMHDPRGARFTRGESPRKPSNM